MKFALLVALLLLTFGVNAASKDVELVGHFSNLVVANDDDPHLVSGFTINLYRSKDILFGSVDIGIGAEEAAHGTLSDLQFDEGTKRLHFRATYSEGWLVDKKESKGGREAITTISFSGRLSEDSLNGQLIKNDWNGALSEEDIVLKRMDNDTVPVSFASWRALHKLDAPDSK